MAKIEIPNGMSLDKALKIFNSMCEKEQILSSYKKKQFYVKPSDAKRERRMAAIRKAKKNLFKEQIKEESKERKDRRGNKRNR